MPNVDSLDHLVLNVLDVDATIAFYRDGLGMTPESFDAADASRRHALRFGGQKLNLHESGRAFWPKTADPRPDSADLCFLSGAPLAEWQAHLAVLGVAMTAGPLCRTGAAGPSLSLYLRDPDRNLVGIAMAS